MSHTRIFESLLKPVKNFPTSFFFLSFILWIPEIFAFDAFRLLNVPPKLNLDILG